MYETRYFMVGKGAKRQALLAHDGPTAFAILGIEDVKEIDPSDSKAFGAWKKAYEGQEGTKYVSRAESIAAAQEGDGGK